MATVGRKKRKRKPGARTGVRVSPHTRSPRGNDKGKRPVRVDPYQRGKPKKKKGKKQKAAGASRRRRKRR